MATRAALSMRGSAPVTGGLAFFLAPSGVDSRAGPVPERQHAGESPRLLFGLSQGHADQWTEIRGHSDARDHVPALRQGVQDR